MAKLGKNKLDDMDNLRAKRARAEYKEALRKRVEHDKIDWDAIEKWERRETCPLCCRDLSVEELKTHKCGEGVMTDKDDWERMYHEALTEIERLRDSVGSERLKRQKAEADIESLRKIVQFNLHLRKCWSCGNVDWHRDNVSPYVECRECGSKDTRVRKLPWMEEKE